jgi:hypothetical protein
VANVGTQAAGPAAGQNQFVQAIDRVPGGYRGSITPRTRAIYWPASARQPHRNAAQTGAWQAQQLPLQVPGVPGGPGVAVTDQHVCAGPMQPPSAIAEKLRAAAMAPASISVSALRLDVPPPSTEPASTSWRRCDTPPVCWGSRNPRYGVRNRHAASTMRDPAPASHSPPAPVMAQVFAHGDRRGKWTGTKAINRFAGFHCLGSGKPNTFLLRATPLL